MDTTLTLEEWRTLFVLVKALGNNDGELISANDVECKRTAVVAPLKTPARFKKTK
jgi:hypothetical protein